MSYSQSDVLAAYDHFERNWGDLQRSNHAACTFCLAEFSPLKVKALYRFEDGIAYEQSIADASFDDTARCPKCELPYVICDGSGLPVTAAGYLTAVNQHWHSASCSK